MITHVNQKRMNHPIYISHKLQKFQKYGHVKIDIKNKVHSVLDNLVFNTKFVLYTL